MYIGYIVGIIAAISIIICGGVAAIYAKNKKKKCKRAILAIVIGIIALISAFINFNLFGN